ncbi:MAG: metal-dependent hydrolase [Clostridia bacterium]|nr:metal-dependent hydrolase [Clostridia bacterium]
MKGSTHAVIGIAAANTIQRLTLSTIISSPMSIIYLIAAYAGALFCDLDMGSSTISNKFTFIKSKQFRQAAMLIYIVTGIVALAYFYGTIYFGYTSAVVLATGLSLTKITSEAYKAVRKVSLIIVAGLLIWAGVFYKQPPLIVLGVIFITMIFSPHRAYSHSLFAVAACYCAAKYVCNYYRIMDVSTYFALGMLSHILSDMFTAKGAMILFPYSKRISFPVTTTTGSMAEGVVAGLALIVAVLSFIP